MTFRIIEGCSCDKMDEIEPHSVDLIFTSPDPLYNTKMRKDLDIVMDKAWNVLKPTGSLWLQLGDYHNEYGSMMLLPERFMTKWSQSNWILRSKLIWHRTEDSPMEETNRFRRNWEYLLMYTKQKEGYYFNEDASWNETSVFGYPYDYEKEKEIDSGFPEGLIEIAIGISCPSNGTVLDPFAGSGITGVVALRRGLDFIGIEMRNTDVIKMNKRLSEAEKLWESGLCPYGEYPY
jgi:DNA modification methylase